MTRGALTLKGCSLDYNERAGVVMRGASVLKTAYCHLGTEKGRSHTIKSREAVWRDHQSQI